MNETRSKTVMGRAEFWEASVAGYAWGVLVLVLGTIYMMSMPQTDSGIAPWLAVSVVAVLTSGFVALGFILTIRQLVLRRFLETFLSILIGGLVGLAVGSGLVWALFSLYSVNALVAEVFAFIPVVVMATATYPLAIGSGFILVIGILFSVLRFFNPLQELKPLMPFGVIGAILGGVGIFLAPALGDAAVLRFVFSILFFLLPATISGAVFFTRTRFQETGPYLYL